MARMCTRPGCSEVAAVAFGFDAERLLVWIAAGAVDADPMRAGALCRRHADAMVVPRGWTLDDRRERTDGAWTADFDAQDDLGGLLAADSPLLGRAFRGTARPR